MDEIGRLRRAVTLTLERARARTGCAPAAVPSHASGDRPDPGSRLARAVERQRHLCADLRAELEALSERRHGEAASSLASREREREALALELSVVTRGIALARRRRLALEGQVARRREELRVLAALERQAALTVVDARDAAERISTKLKVRG